MLNYSVNCDLIILNFSDGCLPLKPKGLWIGHGGRDSSSSGGRECFYRVIFVTIFFSVFFFPQNLKHSYLEKVIFIEPGTLVSVWNIFSFVWLVVFLPVSAKMLVITVKLLLNCSDGIRIAFCLSPPVLSLNAGAEAWMWKIEVA